MYQINRANHIVDEVHISDNGKELVLTVDIGADKVANSIADVYKRLGAAQAALSAQREQSDPDALQNALSAVSDATRALFAIVFGDEQAGQIIDFYGGGCMEALSDLSPYTLYIS